MRRNRALLRYNSIQNSFGPALVAFNLADLGTVDPIPAQAFIWFDQDHRCAQEDPVFILATMGCGFVATSTKRGIVLLMRVGVGPFWYGDQNYAAWAASFLSSGPPYNQTIAGYLPPLKPGFTQDPGFPATHAPISEAFNGQKYYFDISGGGEGPHAALGTKPQLFIADPDTVPGQTNVWDTTFSVIDLLSKTSDNPWFQRDPSNPGGMLDCSGMAMDEAHKLLCLVQADADGTDPDNPNPIVHCYGINN